MKPIPDNNSNIELVELRDDGGIGRLTPHCKKHGAMLKISPFGYWRCIRAEPFREGNWKPSQEYEGDCRAGCIYER